MTTQLLHGNTVFSVSTESLRAKCGLFRNDAALAGSRYKVKSPVSPAILKLLIAAIEGADITITNRNMAGLVQLCTEFQFSALDGQISSHFASAIRQAQPTPSTNLTAMPAADPLPNAADPAHNGADKPAMRAWPRLIWVCSAPAILLFALLLAQLMRAPTQTIDSETSSTIDSETSPTIDSETSPTIDSETSPTIDSEIFPTIDPEISPTLPPLFSEFFGKRIDLLWRGTRDGFTEQAMLEKCKTRTNTRTLVLTIIL
jgi:hypothetical protein